VASLPAAGTYRVTATNTSTDLAVPSYALDVSPPRRGFFDFELKDGATVIAAGSGTKPLNLAQTVTAAKPYTLVVTPRSGKGTATMTASSPGRTPKQDRLRRPGSCDVGR